MIKENAKLLQELNDDIGDNYYHCNSNDEKDGLWDGIVNC